MKKILLYILPLFFAAVFFTSETKAVTLDGKVLYDTLLTPTAGGYVKAFKLIRPSYQLLKVDSANIGAGGSYTLANVTAGDTVYLFAYSSGTLDFVPGYYPGTNNWQTATKIIAVTSQNNLDIKVRKLYNASAVGVISGTVSYSNGLPLKDALVYLKTQIGTMISWAVTKTDGTYSIPNVAEGSYQITVNRIGFNNNSVFGIELNYTFGTELQNQNFSLEQTVSITQTNSIVPEKYRLYQNYPNPFNPTTKIKFDIQKAGAVKLSVYNSLGKLVKNIVNQYAPAGSFEVIFDGKDLSSGIYYYKMEVDGFVITKKMMLVK